MRSFRLLLQFRSSVGLEQGGFRSEVSVDFFIFAAGDHV